LSQRLDVRAVWFIFECRRDACRDNADVSIAGPPRDGERVWDLDEVAVRHRRGLVADLQEPLKRVVSHRADVLVGVDKALQLAPDFAQAMLPIQRSNWIMVASLLLVDEADHVPLRARAPARPAS
jgi:hypothetical protein